MSLSGLPRTLLAALLVLGVLSTACDRDASLGKLNPASAQPKLKDPPKPPAASDAAAANAQPEPTTLAPSASSQSAAGDAAVAAKSKRPKSAKVRTIEPLSPSRGECLEMVSFCSGQPRRCTSSPIHVACGEEVEVKSRKEWLRCECR